MRPNMHAWQKAIDRWSKAAILALSGAFLLFLYSHRDQPLLSVVRPGIFWWFTTILIAYVLGAMARNPALTFATITFRRIQHVPGAHLRAFGGFFFSRNTYSEILEPILRDLFDEYCEALATDHLWKARWICLRGYWSFWLAVTAQLPVSAAKMAYKIWKATR
jgi:hypothetical protein